MRQRERTTLTQTQGYEVTEEEVQMPLAEFKTKYSNPLGYPEYVPSPTTIPASCLRTDRPTAAAN